MATLDELEVYEKERKDGFNKIAVGSTDVNGNKIYEVYTKGDEFAVYAISSGCAIKDMKVLIASENPDNEEPVNNFQAVKIEFDKLKAVSDRCDGSSYTARTAHALSVAILGNPENAKNILSEIYDNIIEEYKERAIGKLIYLSGSLIVALIICSMGLYLYMEQPEFFVKDRTALYELILVCSFATLGGIVSVSRNINSINIDKGLGHLPYFIYGIERNSFSILGGVFIFLIIKSNLLFGFINTLDSEIYALLVFGFLAGFSETLVPNALKKLEDRANSESKE